MFSAGIEEETNHVLVEIKLDLNTLYCIFTIVLYVRRIEYVILYQKLHF